MDSVLRIIRIISNTRINQLRFQHPDVMGQGHIIENAAFRAGLSTTLKPLPDFYANIPPISTNIKTQKFPKDSIIQWV